MKRSIAFILLDFVCLFACQKERISTVNTSQKHVPPSFVQYTILKGKQYCDKTSYDPVALKVLAFKVRFDSSAVYSTVDNVNQTDINKLLGFSDNNALHHEYSARFGWRWSDHALRLFAYVYNSGVVSFRELGTVQIGPENDCAIAVSGDRYVFTLNGKETLMQRSSTTPEGQGYKLYPYFGGDECAPHTISIWIEEL